jgi:hypothetical protein
MIGRQGQRQDQVVMLAHWRVERHVRQALIRLRNSYSSAMSSFANGTSAAISSRAIQTSN